MSAPDLSLKITSVGTIRVERRVLECVVLTGSREALREAASMFGDRLRLVLESEICAPAPPASEVSR